MKESEPIIPQVGRFLFKGILTVTSIYLANSAFTRSVRRQIWERANNVSEISGRSDFPRECSHFNHDRNYPYYNHPDNGQLVLRNEHYMIHYDEEGQNGLSEEGNQFALEKIWERMTDVERREVIELGYPPPYGNYQPNLL